MGVSQSLGFQPSSFPLQPHPLAELFPPMSSEDLAALAQNIRENGLHSPITLYEGKILDGRNRWQACQIAGVEPHMQNFPADGDPVAFVVASNLHRRHLTTSQRALVAARLANLHHGGARNFQEPNLALENSLASVAEKLSVSKSSVKNAKTVLQNDTLIRAVESGQKSVHAAAREIRAAQSVESVPRDATDSRVPEASRPLSSRKSEVDDVISQIAQIHDRLKAALEANDLLFAHTTEAEALGHLEAAHDCLARSSLFAICKVCNGIAPHSYTACQGHGFINEPDFDRHAAAAEPAPNASSSAANPLPIPSTILSSAPE